jgi:caa(3)-type oxidase subunit IV
MMPESASSRRKILIRPVVVWVVLLGLGAISLIYALLPSAPFKTLLSLVIVMIQGSLILGAFMNLGKSGPLVRMTALIGTVWLSFLFLMAFADLATR